MSGNGYKIFVGGLNYNTTDDSLRDYFEQFGMLQDFIVLKTNEDNRSRGFGFVVFEDENSMDKVLETPKGHVIDGRTVEVKNATPREEVSGGGGRRFDRDRGGDRGGRGRGSDKPVNADGDKESKMMRKLFIGGLSYNTTEEGLAAYFMNFGPLAEHVLMKFPDSGKSKGFGFVVFERSEDLDRCQEARPHKLDNKQIDTKRATPASATGKPEAMMSVKRIFVAGLKDDISDDDLEEYFNQFGHVTNVEQMLWNETGKKRGFGFVEFKDTDIVDKVCLLGGHSVKGFELDTKKALSKDEMKEAENRQEARRGDRERDGMGREGSKRQRMDEQWNSGSGGNYGNGGGNWGNNGGGNTGNMGNMGGGNMMGYGNNMGGGNDGGMNPMKMMQMMMGMFGGGSQAPGNTGHDNAMMNNMMTMMARQGREHMKQMMQQQGRDHMSQQSGGAASGGPQNTKSEPSESGTNGAAVAGGAGAGYWGANGGGGQQQGGGYGGGYGGWGAGGQDGAAAGGGYGSWGTGGQQGASGGTGGQGMKRDSSGGQAPTYWGTSGYGGGAGGGRGASSY